MSVVTTKDDFHVGQEVILHIPSHRRGESPDRQKGTIIKIARKYLTVEYLRYGNVLTTEEFEIETRRERVKNGYSNYLAWIETPESQAKVDRRQRAQDVWTAHKLKFDSYGRNTLTTDQMEAIALILDPSFVPGPEDPT